MPGFDVGCKFHWEDEPVDRHWIALYRDCHNCGGVKYLAKNCYTTHPDGSKHPINPLWLCIGCILYSTGVGEELKIIQARIKAERETKE